jgi:hypothetical protein
MLNSMKVRTTILSALFLLASVQAASAHKFVLTPDKFDAAQGETTGIWVTFTEIIGGAEQGLTQTYQVYDPMVTSFDVIYRDGSRSVIPGSSFKPYDWTTKTPITGEVDYMTNPSDVDFATIRIEKPGTAVVQGKFNGDMDLGKWDPNLAGIVNHSTSHVKTFLNLTNDGMAAKRLGVGAAGLAAAVWVGMRIGVGMRTGKKRA